MCVTVTACAGGGERERPSFCSKVCFFDSMSLTKLVELSIAISFQLHAQ